MTNPPVEFKMDILNSLIDNLEESLIILDKDGRVILFNEIAAELNKSLFTKPFQPGDHFINSTNLEMSLAIQDIIQDVRQRKTAEKYFAELKNHNGTLVSLEFNFVPVINDEGAETHIHLLIRDVTSQKVFERKLITQAANISSLIEKANAVIIGMDTRGYVTDLNEHCVKITGFRKDEVYAQKFVSVLMKDVNPEKFETIFAKALNSEFAVSEELLIRTERGNLMTLLLSCSQRLSASGQVVGLTLVGQDVTELTEYRMALEMKVEERTRDLKRALQKEKEAVETKSRFVSIASHEFRSPLSSIQFQISFIKQNNGRIHWEDMKRSLDSIEKHAHHMSALLDDVLTYEKTETGKIKLDITSIEVNAFLNGIVEEVSLFAQKVSCTISTEFNQIPTMITSDERLLQSIFINLLTNAIKFSPGKEHVFLTVKGSGHQLIIVVRDEGIGIPEDEIDKIFDPFLRGRSVGSIQGTGLGLSIVKKSVELLRGTIHAKSEVGKGTAFTVTIPVGQNN
ncbi:MAG: PAS domain-containing sensor histidine kinase [Bacteroidetes bacterium]|nr:PAS domain-containing sensor histidine kinase [Bacteroidota bacterium]